MGWLNDLTTWLHDFFLAIWDAICNFFHDAGVYIFQAILDGGSYIINHIPAPDFLNDYSLSAMIAAVNNPTFFWAISEFKIPECFAVIAAGVLFNLTRKALTLGQW